MSRADTYENQNGSDPKPSDAQDDPAGPDDAVQSCGYGRCRPSCLKNAASSKTLLAAVCCFVFVNGFLINGINNANTTSLERNFDLSSTNVAWISSAYDLSAGLASIVLGYLAMFVHKGRLLSICAGCMMGGSFLLYLPHLLAGRYELGVKPLGVCDIYGNGTTCGDDASNSDYLYVFILGMLLCGIGGACVYTVGVTWIDENVKSKNTPLYLGIMFAVAAAGPVIGYTVSRYILAIYVDADRIDPEDLDITPYDPRWVGAWWIGYIISVFGALITCFIMTCFPRTLPDAIRNKEGRKSQAHKGAGEAEMVGSTFGISLKDLGVSLKVILSNPIWHLLTLAGIVEVGAVVAVNTFLPKILQFQFGMTAPNAAFISGVVVVPAAVIGQFLGGLIPKLGKFKVRGLLLQCATCSVLGTAMAAVYLIRCDMPSIAGVTSKYPFSNKTDSLELGSDCNSGCSCSSRSYEPVCSTTDMQYFSPCHAGCMSRELVGDKLQYTECSCIPDSQNTTISQWEAVRGICDINCDKLNLFLGTFFFVVLVTFVGNTAGSSVVIRIVADKSRPFSYGLQSALVRLIGNVPGPILVGAIFDQSCLVWQDNCGSRGACWIYDSAVLSWRLFLMNITVNIFSGVMFFLSVIIYKPPKTTDDEKDGTSTDKIDMDHALGMVEVDGNSNPSYIAENVTTL